MHTLYLLFTLLFTLSLSQTTFYVEETNKTHNTDGSRDHPFASFDDAALNMKSGTFNIILLGQSITITSQVTFSEGFICIIKPQTTPKSGYYPLKFGTGGSISIRQANVTFQNIQFVELDPERGLMRSAIDIYGGLLFLNRTLVSDIQYQEFSYSFISASSDSALHVVDSQFKNLKNVQIYTEMTQVTVENTSFENLEMDEAFLTLWPSISGDTPLRMSNISLVNGTFRFPYDLYSTGLVHLHESCGNISIEGFSVKNASIKNGAGLIVMSTYYVPDAPKCSSRVMKVDIEDFSLEDIVEIEAEVEESGGGAVLRFEFDEPAELTVRSLTARNMQLKHNPLLAYYRFESSEPLSRILLQDIKINNSSNANFFIFGADSGQVEDFEFMNVTAKASPVFSFENSGTVSIKNFYGRNISGSVVSLEQVFGQNLENLTLKNVSTMSRENSLIRLTRYSNITEFRANVNQSTMVSDLFIDGYEEIGAEEEEAYLMRIEAEIGTVLIKDSIWRNINTGGGLLSHNMSDLKMDNLTVENFKNSKGEGKLVNVNSGLVVVNNSEISEISGQLLFDFKRSSVRIDGMRIIDIDCSEVKEACILSGKSVELEWEDTKISNVVFQGDLVVVDEKSVEKGEVKIVNITKVE